MLKLLRSVFSKNNPAPTNRNPEAEEKAPEVVLAEGLSPFPIVQHLAMHNGFPILDWEAVQSWVTESQLHDQQEVAWASCERAWLMHVRQELGTKYHLAESDTAVLLSSLEPNVSHATLDYMGLTLKRVGKILEGIAQISPWGKDILIVFDDEELYYNYVSHYYPEEGGDFAFSGGMHIDAGCSHYVTMKGDLRSIEPVIAHEMTHGYLAHLPLPLWLNEGLAVNTERRLTGSSPTHYTPLEMREKHLSFWGGDEIQQFWSGESFYRPDDGNLLSYDLARILVEHMAKDWKPFRQFVLHADWNDGGENSAEEHLGVKLGGLLSSLLENPGLDSCAPDPGKWQKNQPLLLDLT